MTTRTNKSSPWDQAVNLGWKINGSATDRSPWVSRNSLELFITSNRIGGYGQHDIYVSRRETVNDPWGVPVNLGSIVNSSYGENWPCLSSDDRLLLFCDRQSGAARPGGYGNADIWMTRRASVSEPWQVPVNLGLLVNGPAHDLQPRISSDGRMLYFTTFSPDFTNVDNWQVPIIPVVDFNGDSKVDGNEVLVMVEYWDQNEPLCDIGPMPWGDGVVDLNDLIVLAGFIGKSVPDINLVACVGDSITYGYGISDLVYNSYPAQLGRMLKEYDDQWRTVNFGVGGATLLRNGDKPYVEQSKYYQVLEAKPDVVIIMLGTNDSIPWNWMYKDDFVSDYIYLIDTFAQLPSNPDIWICKPVPAFSNNFSISNQVIRDEIIPFIDQIAQQRNVGVIDLYTALSGASGLFPDGIHPNEQGAEMIADVITHVIIDVGIQTGFNRNVKVNSNNLAKLAQH
jgi:acyl-CoA thioesterase-1